MIELPWAQGAIENGLNRPHSMSRDFARCAYRATFQKAEVDVNLSSGVISHEVEATLQLDFCAGVDTFSTASNPGVPIVDHEETAEKPVCALWRSFELNHEST